MTQIKPYQIENSGWTPYLGAMPTFDTTTNGVDAIDLTDADEFLQKGAKVQIASGAGVHTYYVVDASSTGFDVAGETSVTGTITAMRYSYADCPFGFKKGQDWYKFSARPDQLVASGTNTVLTGYSEHFDTNSDFTGGIYTIPVTGSYEFVCNYIFDDLGVDKRVDQQILINGGVEGFGHAEASQGHFDPSATSSTAQILYRGDEVKINGYQEGGSTERPNAASVFYGKFTGI